MTANQGDTVETYDTRAMKRATAQIGRPKMGEVGGFLIRPNEPPLVMTYRPDAPSSDTQPPGPAPDAYVIDHCCTNCGMDANIVTVDPGAYFLIAGGNRGAILRFVARLLFNGKRGPR